MSNTDRKCLFTPGPLNTSLEIREAMLEDMGSREHDFIQIIDSVRQNLLEVSGLDPEGPFTVVPMQGSGTFSIEAAIGTFAAPNRKMLVLVNGAYGRRMFDIAQRLGIEVDSLEFEETEAICPQRVVDYLAINPSVTLVVTVHCETTTGIMNPLEKIGSAVAQAGRKFMVDAMSSFGGIEIDFDSCHIDCLVSSANKCLEGVPGLGFVIAKKSLLAAASNQSRSLSLDLHAQWQGLENSGQFRFTPPTHVILALKKALDVLKDEGGVKARSKRYKKNHQALMEGMTRLGFKAVIEETLQSPIITTFHEPKDPHFDFLRFYELLAEENLLIYPGKVSRIDSFRIGTIGDLRESDFVRLLDRIEESLKLMNLPAPIDS